MACSAIMVAHISVQAAQAINRWAGAQHTSADCQSVVSLGKTTYKWRLFRDRHHSAAATAAVGLCVRYSKS
jgi:hypothetical protein